MNNYHTHTYKCKHAIGTVEEYVQAAITHKVEILGMSEHVPFPDNRWLNVRLAIEELDDYCKAIQEAKEKYKNIKLLKGLECEYVETFHHFYKEELLEKREMDYLILSGHPVAPKLYSWDEHSLCKNEKDLLKKYGEYLVKAMETGFFRFVAHPDIFGYFYLKWDEETIACSKYILEAAESMHMPLEINGYGLRKPKVETMQGVRHVYPLHPFWEMASGYDIEVITNSDAHKPEDIIANIEEAREWVKQYDLKLIEFI